ncbi:MAG: tetratricopeptide repeat protein [Hydrococcus sp. RM1_1_31]|nr:tetratricopeptide repeat protein [Hydrococcus sp. RM1_1_31]
MRRIKLLFIFLISVLLSLYIFKGVVAQPSQLKQAQQYYEQGQYQTAIAILESYLKTSENDKLEAYYPLGKAYAAVGQFGAAIRLWDKAILAYQNKGNNRELAQVSISQAQAYIDLGQAEKAIEILNQMSVKVQSTPELEASTRGVLGNAHFNQGNWDKAIKAYLASLKLSRTTQRIDLVSAALNNLTTTSLRLVQKYERDAFFAEQEKDESEVERLNSLANNKRLAASQYSKEAVEVSRKEQR